MTDLWNHMLELVGGAMKRVTWFSQILAVYLAIALPGPAHAPLRGPLCSIEWPQGQIVQVD